MLSSLVFSSCSQPAPSPKKDKYTISFKSALDENEGQIEFEFSYDFSAFEKSGTLFDKTVSYMSFASIIASYTKQGLVSFFNSFGFSDTFFSEDFDQPDYRDSIKYSIASREFDGYYLIHLNTDGVNYGRAWEGNFTIGESGNSQGFQIVSDKVLSGLDTYLSKYTSKPLKLWISGYSRGGAIANIVASTLLENEKFTEDNMYAYTFEAAKGIAIENVKEHKSIHNIINSGDTVTHVIPTKWGLSRVGTDIDIYNKKIDRYLKRLNSNALLPEFTPATPNYATETAFIDYSIDQATKVLSNEDVHDISTRDNYATYYQDYVTYLLGLFFSIESSTMDAITSQISKMSPLELAGLLAENGPYNFLKPILDAYSENYNDTMLRNSTNALIKLANNLNTLLALLLTSEGRTNLTRSLMVHYPEAVLALLINY